MMNKETASYNHVGTNSMAKLIDIKMNEKQKLFSRIGIIVSFLVIIVGLSGFSVPIYKFIKTGEWISNPFNDKLEIIPYFNTLTIHVLIALFWSLCLPFQLISGIYIAFGTYKNGMDIGKYNQYKKFHKFFGSKLAPIAITSYLGLAYILIGLRWNELEISFIYVNVLGGIGMIFYFWWGMYFIYIQKDIKRHRDCMMSLILFSFSPATNRIFQYIFYFIYWMIYGNISYHPSKDLLVVFGAIYVFITTAILQYERIYKWHNSFILFSSTLAIVLFSCITAGIVVLSK